MRIYVIYIILKIGYWPSKGDNQLTWAVTMQHGAALRPGTSVSVAGRADMGFQQRCPRRASGGPGAGHTRLCDVLVPVEGVLKPAALGRGERWSQSLLFHGVDGFTPRSGPKGKPRVQKLTSVHKMGIFYFI